MQHYDDIAAEDYYEMALEWIHSRNHVKAVEFLEKSIDLNPNFIYAYITLAETHGKDKNYVKAFQALKKAAARDPNFDHVHYLAAKYAYKSGDYVAARKYIDIAISLLSRPLYTKARDIILRTRKNSPR
jgi:tetratricopeptide (TPR) repeat protein